MGTYFLFFALILVVAGDITYYSNLFQLTLTSEEVAEYKANGTLVNCTTVVETCNETEYRRINGTCNNLNYPAAGAARTPPMRLLPAEFNRTADDVFDPKLAESSEALPPCRVVREEFLADGVASDQNLTSLIAHMLVSFATDSATTGDTTNFLNWRTHCCKDAGKSDPMCYPITVTKDDRVHRYSGITCLNMTRLQTYATSGCCPNTTTPLRIVGATPQPDLSHIYGNVEDGRRSYSGGNLSVVNVNGKIFPNQTGINLLLGINFFGIIFFWRNHNFIATQLAKLNTDWDDDRLFWEAREINIAVYQQIIFCELWLLLLGKDELLNDCEYANCSGFSDKYDNSTTPAIYVEYMLAMRTLHSLQNGRMRLYDTDGNYLRSYPATNLTNDLDFVKEGDNMIYLLQNCFREPTAKTGDGICDPDINNKGLGMLQVSTDIPSNDLCKSRLQGMAPYIKYRYLCFGDNITCFDDLEGIIRPEDLIKMRQMYGNVSDVDALVGIWGEINGETAFVSPTFACIVKLQLKHFIKSDRYFFESPTRPHAFTENQLAEIRKASAARLLCDIGDNVTQVQPSAFEVISASNPLTCCDDIPSMDFSAWCDS